MPVYCYTTDDGETVEKYFPMMEVQAHVILDDGRMALRDYGAEHKPKRSLESRFPYECVISGVNASQAQELRDFYHKH